VKAAPAAAPGGYTPPVAVSVREYGLEAAPAFHGDRGRPSLLVLTAPLPAGFSPGTKILLHETILEGEAVLRVARESGVPCPLLPPVPARDARRLRDLLAARGVRSEVHPLGGFKRIRVEAGSSSADTEEAIARTLAFAADAGVPGAEMPQLEAVLREAVQNAAHHGNKDDAAKPVRVDLVVIGTLVTLAVEDDGPGFDHAAALAELARAGDDALVRAGQRAAAGRRGGLGILLMRRWADSVEWEKSGRRVRLVKQVVDERR
jgi:anti-sigma regulatory factor (Ser/Thr protein kinase)